MSWSWTIGSIAGIRLRMHWTFLLLLVWVAASIASAGEGMAAVLGGLLFVLAVFACIVFHELGHAIAARRFGVITEDVTLLPIGGVARLQCIPAEPWQELWIAVAGPAVTLLIAVALFFGLILTGDVARLTSAPGPTTGFFVNLMWVNVVLLAFNLLPAFPMDGGRVLRAVLAMKTNYVRATDVAATIGQAMAILFALVGLFVNFWLVFIAIFVYLGAQSEAQLARVRFALGNAAVHDAMMTRFRTLRPDDTLEAAADELLAGAQQDFPVVDEQGFHGMLRHGDLVNAIRFQQPAMHVAQAATKVDQPARESDPLEPTMERMRRTGWRSLPVFCNDKLVGLVSLENIAELIMIRTAQLDHHRYVDTGGAVHPV